MNQAMSIERPPIIVGYSLILPVAWIAISLLVTQIGAGFRLGIPGTAILFMSVAAFTSWLFATRHRRDYSNSEYWRLILYCTSWAVLLELFVMFAVIVIPQMEVGRVEVGPLMFAVPFTIVLDFAFIWLAFRRVGRQVISWHLKKSRAEPGATDNPDDAQRLREDH